MDRVKSRHSGIELLRIFAAMAVVMLHYNDGRGFKYAEKGSVEFYVLFFLEALAICCVDLFIIISGYFSSQTQKRSFLKPLELIIQVIFFKEFRYIVRILLGSSKLSIVRLFGLCLVPDNYFIILYCALYLISPYINVVLNKLDSRQWKHFLGLLLALFSIWTILVDISEEVLGYQHWFGLSTITAWGSHQGFNLINFILMYVIGAYLRRCETSPKLPKSGFIIATWIATVNIIFIWSLISGKMHLNELRTAWMYHNPLVILSAVLLFILFRQFNFRSAIINHLANASFTCFLIHGFILEYVGIKSAVDAGVGMMLLHITIVILGIYLLSWVIYRFYEFATRWIFNQLGQWEVFQSREVI
jgi:surface polysaccharide O-acyltransferase-like enzyme